MGNNPDLMADIMSASAMGLWIEILQLLSISTTKRRQPLRWGCGLK